MPVSDEYIDLVRDLLADFEPLRIKRMFGGAGIYSDELFFAILVDNALYLKTDDLNREDFARRGLRPFTYQTKAGRTGSMSYYPVPAEALEDQDKLGDWARGALEAARRAARNKGAGR
jgi:DNA transformation protein